MSVIEQVETETVVIDLPWDKLAALATVGSVAATDNRPLLTGVQFREIGGVLVTTATDSYSLARITSEIPAPAELNRVIPAKWLTSAVKQCKVGRMASHPITVSFTGEMVTVSNGSVTVTTQCITGDYPQVDNAIPAPGNYQSELGAFNAESLARMESVLPAARKSDLSTWQCLSMSASRPSVWARACDDLSALFLLMPVRIM